MNRLLSLLLIPFFVLGQALPHSHAGSGVNEPDSHSIRPHVHLSASVPHGDGHHHDSDHQHHGVSDGDHVDDGHFGQALSSPPGDHDSDAIYIAQSNCSLGRASATGQLSFASDGTFVEIRADWPARSGVCCCKQSSGPYAGLPIYLLVASLRL